MIQYTWLLKIIALKTFLRLAVQLQAPLVSGFVYLSSHRDQSSRSTIKPDGEPWKDSAHAATGSRCSEANLPLLCRVLTLTFFWAIPSIIKATCCFWEPWLSAGQRPPLQPLTDSLGYRWRTFCPTYNSSPQVNRLHPMQTQLHVGDSHKP